MEWWISFDLIDRRPARLLPDSRPVRDLVLLSPSLLVGLILLQLIQTLALSTALLVGLIILQLVQTLALSTASLFQFGQLHVPSTARASASRVLFLLLPSQSGVGDLSCEPLALPARWTACGRSLVARRPSPCT